MWTGHVFWKELEPNFQFSPFSLSRLWCVFWVGFTLLCLPFFRCYLCSRDGAAGVSHLFSSNYSGFIYWCRLLKTDLKNFLGGLVHLKCPWICSVSDFLLCRFSFLLLFGGVVFWETFTGLFLFQEHLLEVFLNIIFFPVVKGWLWAILDFRAFVLPIGWGRLGVFRWRKF